MKLNDKKVEELRKKILSDEDFINSRKHKNSLKEYLSKDQTPATNNVIAYFLCLTPKEVEEIYNQAAEKIRQHLKIDV